MKKGSKFLTAWVMALAAAPVCAQTAWTWPGCADVTDADFRYTNILLRGAQPDPQLAEPVKMDFDMDASGNVDIYFIEMRGKVKRYNKAAGTVTTLATLPQWTGPYTTSGVTDLEEGLTGIALDPNFKTNHYVYIHWSPANAVVFRISRFTVSGNTLGAEKVVLDIPAQRNTGYHTGGGMAFDAYGDLWIGQGNNTDPNGGSPEQGFNETNRYGSDEWGASSTAGLRGGILRIHPDNSARGYSIPSGNFGEYFAAQTGNSQYADTSKVRPEIFTKGSRNCYTVQVDPVRRWVLWGDLGPNTGMVSEEFNLRKNPAFMGWPYFVGNNLAFSGAKNVNAPTNTSKWNTGLAVLPAATPAIYPYTQSAAISGPLYRYDGDLVSTVKFPPHFTRKWFTADWNTNQVQVFTLDSAGTTVTQHQRIFATRTFSGIVDLKAGPDGALYVINYGNTRFTSGTTTGITQIAYNGTCRPAEPKLEMPPGTYLNPVAQYVKHRNGWVVLLGSSKSVRVPEGMAGFELYDLMGRKVWETRSLRTGQSFQLPSLSRGTFKYRWVPAA